MEKRAKPEEMILEARNFFDAHKKEIIGKAARAENKVIHVSFDEIASFSPMISETLMGYPEETLMFMETALEESGIIQNARVRFLGLPDSHSEKIRNLRSKHLNKFIQIEGIIRQATEVRPQVVNAKFECPTCGTVISILQIESKFREPRRCSCGRRGGFKLLSKDMVDAQRIVIEEAPEDLSGGEQPRRISIFLKEDLVEPKMEEKTTPGARVRVIGTLKEVVKHTQTGGQLTRYDIAIEANNVIPLEESYEEVIIDEEDEIQIKELAEDPNLFEKLTNTIAPSIYGYKEVKQALVLQLLGGVKKILPEGTTKRGDIHILLVGDPGVAKSIILTFIAGIAPKGRYVAGRGASGAGITATVVRDEFLRGWSLEAGAIVLANKGMLCLKEDSSVWMDDRVMTMEEIWNGGIPTRNASKRKYFKFIPSYDFKKKKLGNNLLYEIMKKPYKGNLVKLKLANGLELSVTPDHKFYASGIHTRQPNFKSPLSKIVLAKDLKKSNYLNNFSIPFPEKQYKEENAYVYGFIYGDGYIDKGGITISQSKNNQYIIDRLLKELPNAKLYSKKEQEKILKSHDGKEYKLISRDASIYLNDRNLMIKYFNEFSHLQKLLSLDEESLCKFMAGVFDSDGAINHLKKKVIALRMYPTKNNKEVQTIMCALKRLGINSIQQTYRKNIYEISISSGKDIKIFWDKIGKYSEKLSKEKTPEIKFKVKYGGLKDSFTKILDVKEEYYEGYVYDINVLNAHNFIANGVLTHNCLDEMDKMEPEDTSAMHEAMEQQFITISKATIQARLRAETSILGAANPKFGRFDPYQTVAAQIDLPPALINRFDIIFIMKDLPDRSKDEAIATHVLMESKKPREKGVISRELFKKYTAYARQRIKPQLTDEAIDEIKKFYVDLRNVSMGQTGDSMTKPLPISARQLDGLVRLSEASAKLRLSNTVTREDARRAIELMKYYLMKVGYDYETQTFDIDRIASGVSASQRGRVMNVKEALSKLEGRLGKLIPLEELKKELQGKMSEKDIDDSLERLARAGDIFYPRKGFVQVM